MSDYITGHTQETIGAKYGAPTVEHMAAALEKFPQASEEFHSAFVEEPRGFTQTF